MPTSPGSDLVPVRRETKRRLARLKGSATYDELVRALLDTVPAGQLAEALGRRAPAAEPRERPPEKQLLIAELAARRWATWLREGKLVERGPRLFAWRPEQPRSREVSYRVVGRRGLPP